jgi:hypothetical protein
VKDAESSYSGLSKLAKSTRDFSYKITHALTAAKSGEIVHLNDKVARLARLNEKMKQTLVVIELSNVYFT